VCSWHRYCRGLGEGRAACRGIGHCLRGAAASISPYQSHGVGFRHILRGRSHAGDRPQIDQRHRDGFGTRLDRQTIINRGESELERQPFLPRTRVVDQNLVERVRVHGVVVRSSLWILERLIARDHGHVTRTTGLVAVE